MILVTGGTGLIGSHLLFHLCSSGKKIRVLRRAGSDISQVEKVFSYYSTDTSSLLSQIEWVEADLLDIYSLLDVMEDVSHIYHCAALISFEKKLSGKMIEVNIRGTENLVNAALEKKVGKFLHMSSIATLGSSEHAELSTEADFWKASPFNSNYAISKYGAEREVWRAAEEGLNIVIVNPSVVIGPGNWNRSTGVMFKKAYEGFDFYSEGGSGFVDVRDLISLMIRLMEAEVIGERFILNAENVSYRTVFDIMHECFGRKKPALKAGSLLSGIGWRLEFLRSVITGKPPAITSETARAAQSFPKFSNVKILKYFPDFKFIPIEKSVKDTCALFLEDQRKN